MTAECKSATVNVSRCYDMLESKLKEADDMEIEIEVLQDSHDALLEYQRQVSFFDCVFAFLSR